MDRRGCAGRIPEASWLGTIADATGWAGEDIWLDVITNGGILRWGEAPGVRQVAAWIGLGSGAWMTASGSIRTSV